MADTGAPAGDAAGPRERVWSLARRSREVVLTAAVVGALTGLIVAGFEEVVVHAHGG